MKLSSILFVISSVNGFPFNRLAYWWLYPETCCQLEWTEMSRGDPLPTDYVYAGEFMNRNWAYTSNKYSWKSDQKGEDTNFPHYSPWYILTNPNKCVIGWYTTRFNGEEIPSDDRKVFPRISSSSYGDFAMRHGAPAATIISDGYVGLDRMTSLEERDTWWYIKHIQLLYVDCVGSILTMSKAILHEVKFDNDYVKKLISNPSHVIYRKRVMVNNSPVETTIQERIQIETSDNASMRLERSHHSYFRTTQETYTKWEASASFDMFGLKASSGVSGGYSSSSESGGSDGSLEEIYHASSRNEIFEFSQEVTIPPFSKTTLTFFSRPVQGKIPFTAVYELIPSGSHSSLILEKTLKKYGMDQKMEKTANGTLLVYYDGMMDIDAGNEIDVDLQTVRI